MSFATINSRTAPRLKALSRVSCGFITRLVWSPDGSVLAVAHGGGVSLAKESFGSELTPHLTEHSAPVKDVAFSPDGVTIATASSDTTVRLWSRANEQTTEILRQHSDAVDAVAFSASGRLLASGGGGGQLWLLDLGDRAASAALSGHSGEITSVVFGGETLASGGWDKTVRLWTDHAPRVTITLEGWARDLAASADSKTLAVACKDGSAWLIDFASGEVARTWMAHDGGTDCVSFSPDGGLLVTGGRDGAIKLWALDAASAELVTVHVAHKKPVLAAAFHPNGTMLVSGGGDHTVYLWGVVEG